MWGHAWTAILKMEAKIKSLCNQHKTLLTQSNIGEDLYAQCNAGLLLDCITDLEQQCYDHSCKFSAA